MKLQDLLTPLVRFVQDKNINTIFVDLSDKMRVSVIPVVTRLSPSEIVEFICREDPFILEFLNTEVSSITVRGISITDDCVLRNLQPENWDNALLTREAIIMLNLTSEELLK